MLAAGSTSAKGLKQLQTNCFRSSSELGVTGCSSLKFSSLELGV